MASLIDGLVNVAANLSHACVDRRLWRRVRVNGSDIMMPIERERGAPGMDEDGLNGESSQVSAETECSDRRALRPVQRLGSAYCGRTQWGDVQDLASYGHRAVTRQARLAPFPRVSASTGTTIA